MKKTVSKLVNKYYDESPTNITALGGGFYGRVFLAELNKNPFKLIVKISLYDGFAVREASQLRLLAAHATLKMPKVYFVHEREKSIPHEAIIMEYIDGVNAGSEELDLTGENRKRIAHDIIENLISYHSVSNKEGFGEINATSFESDWKKYYAPKARSMYEKAKKLYDKGGINHEILSTADIAYHSFDKVFYLPIENARLIHGDYNTWNVLLSKDLSHVACVIDPLNCCYSDSELDLYQLNNANGKSYGLLDLYASKVKLSENFELKLCFYELFSEIMHFYDADIDTQCSNIPKQAAALDNQLKRFGIK